MLLADRLAAAREASTLEQDAEADAREAAYTASPEDLAPVVSEQSLYDEAPRGSVRPRPLRPVTERFEPVAVETPVELPRRVVDAADMLARLRASLQDAEPSVQPANETPEPYRGRHRADDAPVEPASETAEAEDTEDGKDRLTKGRAAVQLGIRAAASAVNFTSKIRGIKQDSMGNLKTRALSKQQERAHKTYEKHARKAETSLFKGRREKFAAKAETSKQVLDSSTVALTEQKRFTSDRKLSREERMADREQLVAKSRELRLAASKIALEKRARRREAIAVKYREFGPLGDTPAVKARREALKNKPSMIDFRKAVLAGIYG